MKIASFCGTALIAIFLCSGPRLARAQESFESWRLSGVLEKGQQIAPVTLNLKDRNSRLVYLGSYIVNGQGSCNSCHTCPSSRSTGSSKPEAAGETSGTPVNNLSYLAGGVPFGAVTSPNLTPDGAGLPGGLTYDQFLSSMQDGQRHLRRGSNLQGMPWPNFGNLFEGDIAAVYEYLRALPSLPSGTCSRANESAAN